LALRGCAHLAVGGERVDQQIIELALVQVDKRRRRAKGHKRAAAPRAHSARRADVVVLCDLISLHGGDDELIVLARHERPRNELVGHHRHLALHRAVAQLGHVVAAQRVQLEQLAKLDGRMLLIAPPMLTDGAEERTQRRRLRRRALPRQHLL
jgi:hypothetical protein